MPRPGEHPALGGSPEHDRAREALEAAFDHTVELAGFGERLERLRRAGDDVDRLYFVQAGGLRVVRVTGDKELWGDRGRDPRVEDLLGPGCFVGLAEAWGWLHGAAPHGLDGLGDKVWREGFANPVLDPRRGTLQPLRLVGIRYTRLKELLAQHPALQAWFHQLHELAVVRRAEMLGMLEADPVLEGMGRADQNAVLHSAAWGLVRYTYKAFSRLGDGLDVSAPLLRAGDPARAIVMVREGQVELKSDQGVVALHTRGDLVLGSLLAGDPDDESCRYPLHGHAGQDAELLVWDRVQLRRILWRSAAGWARLLEYADPRSVHGGRELAWLTIIVAEDEAPDSELLAYGLARVLEDAEPGVGVRLIDLAGGVSMGKASGRVTRLRRERPAPHPPAILVRGDTPPFQELQVEPWAPLHAMLRVIVPDQLAHVAALVESARSQPGVSDVVLHIPPPARLAPHLRLPAGVRVHRNDREARQRGLDRGPPDPRTVLLDALRSIPHDVVWLNTAPEGWWTLTDEAPDSLFRVDRQTPAFLQAARQRTAIFSRWEHADADETDDRPGNAVQHHVHMRDDPDEMRRAAQGALDAVVSDPNTALGETCARLARMVWRRSVGLALGGGGTWGASHIGLIRELERAGVPVDYVSGTSFGSVVGAIYAGAGERGLKDFVDRCTVSGPLRGARLARQALRGLRSLSLPWSDWTTRRRIEMVEASWAGMVGEVRKTAMLVEQVIQGRDELDGPLPLLATRVPFYAAASNLTTQETYVPHWLPVGLAVRAASGLAPSFPALRVAGARMADGAALENVPARILRDHGADYVIAVNVVGAPRAKRDGPPSLGKPWPTATPLRERIEETTTTLWLTIWKAGNDQAHIAADAVVDLEVSGVQLPATWRTADVAQAAQEELQRLEVGPRVREHWRGGGRDKRGPLRIDGEVRVGG